jgi:hypothetical protein
VEAEERHENISCFFIMAFCVSLILRKPYASTDKYSAESLAVCGARHVFVRHQFEQRGSRCARDFEGRTAKLVD